MEGHLHHLDGSSINHDDHLIYQGGVDGDDDEDHHLDQQQQQLLHSAMDSSVRCLSMHLLYHKQTLING